MFCDPQDRKAKNKQTRGCCETTAKPMRSCRYRLTLLLLVFRSNDGAHIQSCTIDNNDSMKIFEHVDPEDSTIIANIPPPLRKGETFEDRQRVDQMLKQYWELGSGYYSRTGTKSQAREYTYGEMSPVGVRQLAQHMELHDKAVVFDVGSGVGKLVVQLYLEHAALHIIGIESCPIRHDIATNVWNAISQTLIHNNTSRSVEFRNQDARVADYTLATHVFLCSLCFPDELTDAVIKSLLRSAEHLQVVAALSELPGLEVSLSWKKTIYNVQTTWGQSTLRIYTLQR